MRFCRSVLFVVFLGFMCVPMFGETWYIRGDGGTRYSARVHQGQCDGKADAPYPGKGTNRHCAFNDYRYLYTDGTYGNDAWVIAGGDTMIIKDGPWRVGYNGPNAKDYFGVDPGNPYGASNPVIPSGTSERHTRILGGNYASCSTGEATDRSKLTQIFGGYGVGNALNLAGAQYVDVECLEITRHSQCTIFGVPANPEPCHRSYPLDDYDTNGVVMDAKTHDVLLQDVWIHGHPSRGVIGPIGGTVTCLRCDVGYNGGAGWDFDDGKSTPSVNAVWNFNYSTIEWNGCNQEYPITHAIPAISCYGQSDGGYGDGVGTPSRSGMSANIDHSTFRYNVQDGLDLLHVGVGTHTLTLTNSIAYGNGGSAIKLGANMQTTVITNNLILANCMRMSAPMAGAPSGYNANLHDFCRASDAVPFNFRQGGNTLIANNTFVTYAPTTFDIGCSDESCSESTLTFKNNVVLAYDNPGTYSLGGKPGGPGGFYSEKKIGHVNRSNNLYHGLRGLRCPTGYPNEKCADAKFVSQPHFSKEQDLDNFNFHLSDASPARSTGISMPEVKGDYSGKARPAAGGYDMGAYQH